MRFHPISIIPDGQIRSTTPDTFIIDQYGKLPDINGDGPLTINEAIRLSKIINGYAPAFTKGEKNKIVWGFALDDKSLSLDIDGNLSLRLRPGAGIINSMIFEIPLDVDVIWKNFKSSIPPNLPEGKLIVYFRYDDLIENYPHRPLPQDYPRKPMVKYPLDQAEFNPIKICHAFYDPNLQDIVNSDFSSASNNIIISSNIHYKKDSQGNVEVWIEEGDLGPIFIGGQEYYPEGGGLLNLLEIDGGELNKFEDGEEIQKEYVAINLLKSYEVDSFSISVPLDEPPDPDMLTVFYNGVLYLQDKDWELEGSTIYFYKDIFMLKRRMFIFENVDQPEYGCLKKIYFSNLTSDVTEISVDGITAENKYLVFRNGILEMDGYTIIPGKIQIEAKENDWIEIFQIYEGRNLSIIYNGNAPNSSVFKSLDLDMNRAHLIFYNGILYSENTDYRLVSNTLIMTLAMKAEHKLLIIGV